MKYQKRIKQILCNLYKIMFTPISHFTKTSHSVMTELMFYH